MAETARERAELIAALKEERRSAKLRMDAWLQCVADGVMCPDTTMHVMLPDGTVGKHAWVMQAIKDAKNAAE